MRKFIITTFAFLFTAIVLTDTVYAKACRSDSDCPVGYECINHLCLEEDVIIDDPLIPDCLEGGESCMDGTECCSGSCLLGFVNGDIVGTCDDGGLIACALEGDDCSSDDECCGEPGLVCSSRGVCVYDVTIDQCEVGYYISGRSCIACPSASGFYNGSSGTTVPSPSNYGILSEGDGGITTCFAPRNTTYHDAAGVFTFDTACYYSN